MRCAADALRFSAGRERTSDLIARRVQGVPNVERCKRLVLKEELDARLWILI
jgi:hypothetical protein